jgi:CheY-like chemotaxis protein
MRRRILLADDSVTIQKVIELTFMDEDYDVKAVSNGDEALAALPTVNPDFVIADVHMPGANGYEVCRRSKESRPDVPVLLLVGTFEPFDEGQARAAGADSFLKKPFDSQELLQRVQELLSVSTGAAAPPPPPEPVFEALPPLDLQPAAAEPDWGSFQLTPEPPAAAPVQNPFLEDESPFVLEDEHPVFPADEGSMLPAGEPMFELEESPAPLDEPVEPALSSIDFEEAPRPAAGFAPPWSTQEPAPEERLGIPESAVPLVDSLAETEERIEAPAPPSIAASHEPEAAWSPEPLPEPEPWSPAPEPPPVAPVSAVAAPASSPLAVGSVTPVSPVSSNGGGPLSDEDVDRIARRVVELMGDRAVRDIAWEVIPDLAEVVIRDRLRELEGQVENPAE